MKRKYILALILIVGMVAGLTTPTLAYDTEIKISGATIAFDIYHGGYHTTAADLDPIIGNLTDAGNTVLLINETWELPDEVDCLILTQCDDEFTAAEKADVVAWLELDDKLLIVSGDSDYDGLFNPWPINNLLDYIGTLLRLATVQIEDAVFNDGAAYRVAANVFGTGDRPGTGYIAGNLTMNMTAGMILHSPTSLVVDDGYIINDLRISTYPNVVEVVMWFSPNSTASDQDTTDNLTLPATESYDRYSRDAAEDAGNYPAIAWESLGHCLVNGTNSALVAGGEAFYTFYKYMYNQKTESGVYNGGTHYGQMFTDNMFNYLLSQYIKTSYEFAFTLVPLAIIGAIYVLMRRRK